MNDKDYGKIDTPFESIKMAPAPSSGAQPGGQTNPGVQRALNTPPTEGRVKTVWYYSPQGPAPRIQGTQVDDRMDTLFEDVHRQSIGYEWQPGSSTRPNGSNAMETPMTDPLQMNWGMAGRSSYQPTPPGDELSYGGGQGPGPGTTPPGDPMGYGGGQAPGGETSAGPTMNYGGGQGPAV